MQTATDLLLLLLLAGCPPKPDTGTPDTFPSDDTGTPDTTLPDDTGTPDTGEPPAEDKDGDGWTIDGGDCDDGDPAIHPGAGDRVGDGVDNDCDGFIDEWASLSEGKDVSGDEAHLHLGWSLSVAGDVDGDGVTDLLAGTASTLGSTRGVLAYLFSGPFTPDLDLARAVITGDVPVPGTGATLAGAGDTNGDGFADFLVGDSEAGDGDGRMYIFLGPVSGNLIY